jgi:periplasmic protein TonB
MKRIPRLLLIAFALSLLVHLIVALILHPPAPSAQNQPEVVSLERRPASIAVKKAVTPPPRPPKRSPAPKTVSSAAPRSPKGLRGPSAAAGTPVVPAAAAPSPTPSPMAATGACTQRNAEPAVADTPPPPEIAPAARTSGTNGVALVRVQLDATGQVTGADVVQSSGNSSLDLVAVTMARGARYSPGLHDCKPIASAYTFSVKFVAW